MRFVDVAKFYEGCRIRLEYDGKTVEAILGHAIGDMFVLEDEQGTDCVAEICKPYLKSIETMQEHEMRQMCYDMGFSESMTKIYCSGTTFDYTLFRLKESARITKWLCDHSFNAFNLPKEEYIEWSYEIFKK